MDMEYVLDRPEASALRTNQVQQSGAGAGAAQGPQQPHSHTSQHTPPQQQQQQQPQPSRCPYFRTHQHHGGHHQHHHQNNQNHFSSLPLPTPHHPQFLHHQVVPSRAQPQAQIPVVGFLAQSPNHNPPPHTQPVAHYQYHYDPSNNLWYSAIHWSPGLPLHQPLYHNQTTASSEAYFASSSENPGSRQGLFGAGAGSGSGSGAVAGSGVAGLGLLQSQPPPVLHHHHNPNTFPPLLLTRPPLPGDSTFAPVLFTGPPPGALPYPGATPLMPSQNHQVNDANTANSHQSSVNPASSYSGVQQLQQTTPGVTYTTNMSNSGGLGPRFTTSRWTTVRDLEGRENENSAPLADATESQSPTPVSGGSPAPWAATQVTQPGPRQGSAESDEHMMAPGSDLAQPDESTTAPRAASAEPGESMTVPRSPPVPMTRSDSEDEEEDEFAPIPMPSSTTRSEAIQQPAPVALSNLSEAFSRPFARIPPEIRAPGAMAQAPRPQRLITRSDPPGLDYDEENTMRVPATRPGSSTPFGRLPAEPPWRPITIGYAPRPTEGRRPTTSRHHVPPPVDSDYDSDEDIEQLEEDGRALRFIEQFSVGGDFRPPEFRPPRNSGRDEAHLRNQQRAHQVLRGQANRRVASRRAISQLQRVDIDSLEESERTCVICYNEYGVKNPEGAIEEPLRLPRCKHLFGANCIKKWFTQSDTCPYCRDKLDSEPLMPPEAQYMRDIYREYSGARPPPGPPGLPDPSSAYGYTGRPMMPMPMSLGGDMNARLVLDDHARVDSSPPRGSQTGERRSPPSEASESRRRTRPRYSGFRASPSAAGSNGSRQSSSQAGGSASIAPPQQSPVRDRYGRQRPSSFHHPRRTFGMPGYHAAEPLGLQPRGPRPPIGQQPVGSYTGGDGATESYQPRLPNHQNDQNNQNGPAFFGTGPYSNPAGLPGPGPAPASGPDQPPNSDTWSQ